MIDQQALDQLSHLPSPEMTYQELERLVTLTPMWRFVSGDRSCFCDHAPEISDCAEGIGVAMLTHSVGGARVWLLPAS